MSVPGSLFSGSLPACMWLVPGQRWVALVPQTPTPVLTPRLCSEHLPSAFRGLSPRATAPAPPASPVISCPRALKRGVSPSPETPQHFPARPWGAGAFALPLERVGVPPFPVWRGLWSSKCSLVFAYAFQLPSWETRAGAGCQLQRLGPGHPSLL